MADEALATKLATAERVEAQGDRRGNIIPGKKRAVTLGELIDDIRNESELECHMPSRLRQMALELRLVSYIIYKLPQRDGALLARYDIASPSSLGFYSFVCS